MKLVKLVFSEVTVAPYGKVLVKQKWNYVRYIKGAETGGAGGGEWFVEPVNESDWINNDQLFTLTSPSHEHKKEVAIMGIKIVNQKLDATGFDEPRGL